MANKPLRKKDLKKTKYMAEWYEWEYDLCWRSDGHVLV